MIAGCSINHKSRFMTNHSSRTTNDIDDQQRSGVSLGKRIDKSESFDVPSFLTPWLAIAAMAICPFFCMAEVCDDTSSGEGTPQSSCCRHCCGPDLPVDDAEEDPQAPCCGSDCLCKGALPVKPQAELPPPVATDMLPVEPHVVGLECFPGDSGWNPRQIPHSPDAGGRGLRIAQCSILC